MPRPAARRTARRAARRVWAAPFGAALLCAGAGEPVAFGQDPPPVAEESNPLAAEPTDAAEFVTAAARLRRIGRPNLAKRYLASFLDSNPSDEALLDARDALGPSVFFELATDPALRPEGATLQMRVSEAFARRAADPGRLDRLIDALTGAPRDAAAARVTLRALGAAAAPRLVERLVLSVDPRTGSERERDAIAESLGEIGAEAVPPLRAVLRSPEASPDVRSVAALALGGTRTDAAVNALLGAAFAADELPGVRLAASSALGRLGGKPVSAGLADSAADRLDARAAQLLADPPVPSAAPDEDPSTVVPSLFRYDAAENRVVPVNLSAGAASRYEAAALATAASSIAPDRDALKSRALAAALAYEAALAGRGAFLPRGEGTVHRAALAAGPARVLAALHYALDARADDAAAAALQVLLDAPARDLLEPGPTGESAVIRALRSPAPEVRFLAALVAARSNPGPAFTAGPETVQVLAGALVDAPGGRAIVIDPVLERATRMGGLLQGLGYRVELTDSAREGFARATSGAGADLIAVQANVGDLPVSQFAANLRADARTRPVPLALYGSERLERPLERIAERAGKATFVPFPVAPESLQRRLAPIAASAPPLPDDLKADQKRAAAYELSKLAAAGGDVFPLRPALPALSAAVADASIAADVARTLAAIPDPVAQDALASVLLVLRPGMEAELEAAAGLTRSVRRYGFLLRKDKADGLRARIGEVEDARLKEALLALSAALPGDGAAVPLQVRLPRQ